MSEQRNLTTVPKGQVPQQRQEADLKRARDSLMAISEKDVYWVAGRKAPSAHLVREMAKLEEVPIKYQIVKVWKTKEECGCILRGWKGPEENPIIEISDSVVHNFQLLLLESVLDAIANGLKMGKQDYFLDDRDWEISADGWPVITNRDVQLQILRNHLGKAKFAERDAVTKCERRILMKLMGKYEDWDNDEEQTEGQTPPVQQSEREPQTLEEYRQAIRTIILAMTDNDKMKAQQLLMELSQVENYEPVMLVTNINNLDYAREILARVRQKEIDMKKGEENERK